MVFVSSRQRVRALLPRTVIGILFLPAALSGLSPWPAGAITLDQIVVVVNDDVILKSEFERRRQLMADQMRRDGMTAINNLLLDKRVLDTLILNKLQLQLASLNNMSVDDESVDSTIAEIAESNNISIGEFRELLHKDGFVFEDFREDMREEILLRRLRQEHVYSRVSISEEEVDYYMLSLERQGATGKEYHLAHILLSSEEGGGGDALLRTRAEIIKEILADEGDFAALAAEFSSADDAGQGGDLGWLSLPDVPSLFVNRLPELEPGDVAGPLESGSGLHFVKLIAIRSSGQMLRERLRARHIVVAVEEGDWVRAQDRVTEVLERLAAGESFAELAREYSDDLATAADGGELGWLEEDRLPPGIYEKIQELQVDELSEPLRSSGAYHLVQLLEKEQHDATVELQREQAREAIYQRKLETFRRQWFDRLRSEAYIEIRLEDEASSG